METLENRISILIKKRMNDMIAIMKDIEKSQTKPTK
ncbi:BfmA/BtgA family mobilization protein [uncultured Maribacter sp.]